MSGPSASVGDETALRRDLVAQYRRASELRLNELASGNLSCRLGDGMLISPTGASAESITEDAVVYVGPNGDWDPRQTPSSEWMMHAAIYRRYADARAVVHTHSDYCVAVSCHNQPLPGFHYLVGVFGGDDVPCVPYATYGSEALAESAAAALEQRTACLLGNHGMICRGRSLRSAVGLAHRLEIMCRQYVLARQLGEPSRLTAADWDDFFAKTKAASYGGGKA
jgi:L-fuculose-phosphate aldolase